VSKIEFIPFVPFFPPTALSICLRCHRCGAVGGIATLFPNRSPTLTWQTAMVMSAVSAALRRTAPIGASRVAAVAGARQFRATPNPGEATPTARRCLEKTGS